MIRKLSAVLVALSAMAAVSCSTRSGGGGDAAPHGPERDFLPGVAIVYSANVDGEIEPCGCRSNPTGGLTRRWNLLFTADKIPKTERLGLDSGDLFYQSVPAPPFLEKQWNYQAQVLLTAYNSFGVDVMTPGDLDFAAGYAQFMKLAAAAKFKIVAANIFRRSDGKRAFEPYVVLSKGGRKVGIFGIYDQSLPLPEELTAKDYLAAAREMVRELRGRADVIIALTHIGLDNDLALAKEISGIDAIFGAHTQSFLNAPEKVGDTLIFQPSFRGQHIGSFYNGEHKMFQVDERFESKPGEETAIDKLLKKAKAEIARINKETEAEMMSFGSDKPKPAPKEAAQTGFQTFTQCAQCHAAQYEFHKKTPHMMAYATLVKKHQAANLDCLRCHTVGAGRSDGWMSVNNLVLNQTGKAISAESFSKSLPNADLAALAKVSKAFVNVQCESCHGAGGGHPLDTGTKLVKNVSSATCLGCHTLDRAPGWYKDGKPDMSVVEAKFKSMSCPAIKK